MKKTALKPRWLDLLLPDGAASALAAADEAADAAPGACSIHRWMY
jgi:hypothetical protein